MLKAYKYRIYPTKSQIELIEKHFGCARFVYINASINIRNYGLGQIDNRNTAGTVGIQACGVPSDGVTTSYGVVASYGSVKQEAQSSLAIG